MQKANVLLFGFGRMGKIHQKYLEEISVNYSVVDPLINVVDNQFINDFDLDQLSSITHVIISTILLRSTSHKKRRLRNI